MYSPPSESPTRFAEPQAVIAMNPKTDKLVRRTTMVATVVASYFLLTADYGPEPNVLDPVKKTIQAAERSIKEFIFGSVKDSQGGEMEKRGSNNAKEHP